MLRKPMHRAGFTLVEIAIVLVIIGLLLGGVLKGQEMINSTKVKHISDQQLGLTAAFFSFQDRYRAVPGDYLAANAIGNIPVGPSGTQYVYTGNGDGAVAGAETGQAWTQLTSAGFINCSVCTSVVAATSATSPTNVYGGWSQIISDAVYLDAGTSVAVNNLKSGGNIPVSVIAEVDRKIDDGAPNTGIFRFSVSAQPTAPTAAGAAPACANTTGVWNASATQLNCGGTSLLR
ncbi:prepilin-type N-terminal cleavage/methylation domain-containing protein [Massilia sp. W12]|uniref:prepilin-type N-terminal cleavage/methylation domain-containing protein n=1 Tax=Massilia sp. W12 TaxID=3126507 RepID=UPI0030D2095E